MTIIEYAIILAQFVIGLGVIKLLQGQVNHIIKRKEEQWYYSVWLIGLFVVFTVAGLIPPTQTNQLYLFMFKNLSQPINSALYCTLAFWMLSASYRAFRVRSLEASLLLVSSILVIFSNTPLIVNTFPIFSSIKSWLFKIPNTAGFRAIMIGSAIASVVLGIRILTGSEKGLLGAGMEEGEA